MTAYPRHAFNVAPGEPQLSPLTLFFRRAIAAVRRKPAAPEVPTSASGAGAGGSDWDDAMPRPHIPADRVATESLAWAEVDAGQPVLQNRMLSEVRAEQDAKPTFTPARPVFTPSSAMDTGEFRALDEAIDAVLRPVNGRSLPDQPRRQPVYGEAPQLEVERDMARAAGERARQHYEPASPRLLDQVLAGLRRL